MSGILWLASYPKSGNTWLRAYLYNLLNDAKKPRPLEGLSKFTPSDSYADLFELVTPTPLSELSAEEIAALRDSTQRILANSSPDTVFVKTHCYLGEVGGHPQISMNHTQGAIYVVRNPLDVCISMAPHYGVSIDQAIKWLNTPTFQGGIIEEEAYYLMSSWSQHVDSWTQVGENDRLKILRYEDMLYKPLPVFKGIAKFLGLKAPTERIKRAIKFSSFRQLRAQEEQSGFNEASAHSDHFFRVGKAGQWKEMLTTKQIDTIVADHHAMMEKFKYLP